MDPDAFENPVSDAAGAVGTPSGLGLHAEYFKRVAEEGAPGPDPANRSITALSKMRSATDFITASNAMARKANGTAVRQRPRAHKHCHANPSARGTPH